jgi:hypothetical protein
VKGGDAPFGKSERAVRLLLASPEGSREHEKTNQYLLPLSSERGQKGGDASGLLGCCSLLPKGAGSTRKTSNIGCLCRVKRGQKRHEKKQSIPTAILGVYLFAKIMTSARYQCERRMLRLNNLRGPRVKPRLYLEHYIENEVVGEVVPR